MTGAIVLRDGYWSYCTGIMPVRWLLFCAVNLTVTEYEQPNMKEVRKTNGHDPLTAYDATKVRMMLDNPVYYPNRAVFCRELAKKLPLEIDKLPEKMKTLYRGNGRVAAELYIATGIAIRMSDENGAKENERFYKPGPAECFATAVDTVGYLHHICRGIVMNKAAKFFEIRKEDLQEQITEAVLEDITDQYA